MALVSYTGKNILGVGMAGGEIVRLLPGINEVDDEKLQIMKAHPLFKVRMDRSLVQIMHENVGKDGKRTVEDMLKHIPQIFDTKLLKKIIDTDGRDKVVRAASDQLEKIRHPAKAKEEAEHFN